MLLLEGGDGRLAQQVAGLVPLGEVLSLTRDVRQVSAARRRLLQVEVARAGDQVLPDTGGWDSVLLTIPKERRYARTLLLAAWEALRPGGTLLLAGPTRAGAKAVIKDAERLFGAAKVVGYKAHQRVARCPRGDRPPDPLPEAFTQVGVAPGTHRVLRIERPEGVLEIDTHPGIFSWDSLDRGTALLLDHLVVRPGERVWDVGCGAGILGLAAALAGAEHVRMTDVNLLAVGYSERNAERNGLGHLVEIEATGSFSTEDTGRAGKWDLIVSNPAFHEGREVNTAMADRLIAAAPELLTKRGRLVLVANRFLAYHKEMGRAFRRVTRLAETPSYHVIEGRMR